jgi:hypothetical protein
VCRYDVSVRYLTLVFQAQIVDILRVMSCKHVVSGEYPTCRVFQE